MLRVCTFARDLSGGRRRATASAFLSEQPVIGSLPHCGPTALKLLRACRAA